MEPTFWIRCDAIISTATRGVTADLRIVGFRDFSTDIFSSLTVLKLGTPKHKMHTLFTV